MGGVDDVVVGEEEVARAARESSASKRGLFHRGSSATEDEDGEPEPPEEEEEEGEASAERWRKRSRRLPQAAAVAASDW